ncbi:MAG: AAA family ATPase [Atopobiaceae bacterium]|nr:AAA family ATPase [Atopobiaceae bacterium]
MDPVKISSLELENVKRIRALAVKPTKDGLTVIGGRNGQGKTSVLDAIAWALGGNKMRPDNPNRDGGATPAKLHVELSNGIVVERRGKNGTLYVTDSTGMKGTQKLLDEFLSQLALDLPKFLGGSDKDRTNALLNTLGIDEQLAALDGQIRSAYQQRTAIGTDARRLRAHADKLPSHDDVPSEPVSVAELVRQQQEILARNGANQKKRESVSRLEWECQSTKQSIAQIEQSIETAKAQLDDYIRDMQERIEQLQSDCMLQQAKFDRKCKDLETAKKTAEQLVDESTAEIERSIADIESVNARVADNKRKAEAVQVATEREQEYADMSATIESLRDQRIALLDGAPLPLEGLSVDEEGRLTYQGQTWGDMSSSEQLRVATAIVRATKPDCGFVLLDKLEQMDTQTLSEFGAWAQGEGLQVIGTRVGTGDECTIVIEDGLVDESHESEPEPEPAKTDWASAWGANK